MELRHNLRSIVVGMPFMLRGKPRERAGEARLASRKVGADRVQRISLTSSAFEERERIPVRFTADGENVPPPLRWSKLPEGTRSMVLLVEDPDAPTPEPFVHWIALIDPETGRFTREGRNTTMKTGWIGCAPPKGDHPHHYHFQLFALDAEPKLGSHPGRSSVVEALQGHVLGFGELVGTYER